MNIFNLFEPKQKKVKIKESRQSFHNGDQVELTPSYAQKPGEVFTVSQCDQERGRCWIGDQDGRGWYATFDQLIPATSEEYDEDSNAYMGIDSVDSTSPIHGVGEAATAPSNSADGYYKMIAYKLKTDPRMVSEKEKQELHRFIMQKKLAALEEHIGQVKDGYRLYSHKGKNLGTFDTKAGAEKHEREVQYFKHKEGVAEDANDSPVTGAITRRILMQRHDLLKQYGPELVTAAIDNVADYVGDVDEIGSSDVSAWVAQVERMLKENPPEAFRETALNTKDPKGDYAAKRKALQDLSMNKDVDQQAVLQRRLDLDREAKAKGVAEGSDRTTAVQGKKVKTDNMAEAFDQPYKTKSEKSDYGDVDMLAKLPDGSNLSIMFNQEYGDEGEEVTQVEFYRNNSQEVTGEGDAQRIFATVLDSIQKYIKKYKPQKLSFSASKEVDMDADDVEKFNPESRAKLYDRLVQRYSKALGYRAFRANNGNIVRYELSRIAKGVAEGSLNELSTEKLAQYKTAAAADATAADKRGDYERGHKRFRGIVQATNKQFDNDAKKHKVNELSKGTLGNYVRANANDQVQHASHQSFKSGKNNDKYNTADAWDQRTTKREKGMDRALNKLTKENLDEAIESRLYAMKRAGYDIL